MSTSDLLDTEPVQALQKSIENLRDACIEEKSIEELSKRLQDLGVQSCDWRSLYETYKRNLTL